MEASLVRHVCDTSGRIVQQLTGASIADAIIATLETRWEERAGAAVEGLPAVDGGSVVVRTSFAPTESQRARLAALARRLHPAGAGGGDEGGSPEKGKAGDRALPTVEFVVDPDLVLGVEIEGGGTAIAWTARDMLDDLRRAALAALDGAVGGRDRGAGAGATAARRARGVRRGRAAPGRAARRDRPGDGRRRGVGQVLNAPWSGR